MGALTLNHIFLLWESFLHNTNNWNDSKREEKYILTPVRKRRLVIAHASRMVIFRLNTYFMLYSDDCLRYFAPYYCGCFLLRWIFVAYISTPHLNDLDFIHSSGKLFIDDEWSLEHFNEFLLLWILFMRIVL